MWCRYVCVSVYIWCSAVMLLTCTLVLSCPAGKEGWVWNMSRCSKQLDTGWAKNKQEEYSSGRPARVSVQTWIEAMKDIFARCSKKMVLQVCTKLWLNCAAERNCHELFIMLTVFDYNCICSQGWICNTDQCLLFVKNKPWLLRVYSWIRHRREK